MTSRVVAPRSMRVAQVFTLALGLGLSTAAIGARIYVKLRIWRQFLSEDYFAAAGYLGFLVYTGLAVVVGKDSLGVERKAYLSTIITILYQPIISFIKTSILLQYVTVFVVHRRGLFHCLVHFIIWANAILYVTITFLYIYRCKPRRKLWIPETPGVCHDLRGGGVMSGSVNVATDFLILILPLPICIRLQMPLNKKLRILSVFGIGLFACIASVVRLGYSLRMNIQVYDKTNQLKINVLGLLAYAEIAIGIIVGCTPFVHKSYKHIRQDEKSSNLRILYSSRDGKFWRKRFATAHSFVAPQITTLNMTRASFSLEEEDMPKPPSPVQREELVMSRETPPSNVMHDDDDDDDSSKKATDVESGIPSSGAWQQDEDKTNSGMHETTRAQYELHPRR